MTERYACSPDEVRAMDSDRLREKFHLSPLFIKDKAAFVYSHYDRMVIGGILPVSKKISLETYDPLRSVFFLQRREAGIINIGGEGSISADGKNYSLANLDCLYLGQGTKDVAFNTVDTKNPAKFYILSAPAHHQYPNTQMKKEQATAAYMGAASTCNERTIYKYIHEDGIQSCQLVMGLTILKSGSVWNTMPAHTHSRRMEVYLYFDVTEPDRIFHFMGEPQQTRHIVIANEEAVISPPWSIHSGCGTSNYSFIWGMAGENQSFADMDAVAINELR